MLRELADQVHMAPMNFPLRRLNREERAMYENILKVSSDRTKSLSGLGDIEHVLQKGMPNSKGEGERSGSKHRSINEYAEYYRRCSTDRCRPSSVMKRALNAAHQWANSSDFIIFSSLMDSDVISQAEASDARHKAGTPLSILGLYYLSKLASINIIFFRFFSHFFVSFSFFPSSPFFLFLFYLSTFLSFCFSFYKMAYLLLLRTCAM